VYVTMFLSIMIVIITSLVLNNNCVFCRYENGTFVWLSRTNDARRRAQKRF
jgi:hypothetical protein